MTRRKYTKDFKQQVIKEALETGNNAVGARRYDLNIRMVGRWVREYKNGKHQASDNSISRKKMDFNK